MLSDESDDRLIAKLLQSPEQFNDEGLAYQLLQRYFAGLPIDSLRPLLNDDRTAVHRSASFIASELGVKAIPIVEDVARLINSSDPHVQWYAMEVVTVCGTGVHAHLFVHVTDKLDAADGALRRLAMRLVAAADRTQLEAAQRALQSRGGEAEVHHRGIQAVVDADREDPVAISRMLADPNALTRRYGAIAARRLARLHPELMSQVRSSQDVDLAKF